MQSVRSRPRARTVACRSLLVGGLLLAGCGGGRSHSSSSTTPAPATQSTPAAPRPATPKVPDGDWTRFGFDAQRSGVGPALTGITERNVNGLKRRTVHIDGVADSSPIALHAIDLRGRARDVVVLTTTYGKTIALDPGTGAQLWEFRPPDLSTYEGSPQVTTASPVADPDRRYVYAASPDGRINKLDLATGQPVRSGGWPAKITSDPTREKLGAALNISGDSVVAVTGGYYGDQPTYQGHVVLIDRASGLLTHVFNTLCSNIHQVLDPPSSCQASDSAIWARSGAVIEPGSRRILIATGNGPFNGSTNWGDSVLELTPDATTLLQNWTPTDQAQLNATDGDLGSTAPALLGHGLAVQGGKDGKLRLLDLSRLNGIGGGPGPRTGGEVAETDAPGGSEVFTAPAVWTRQGATYVFVANDSGTAAYVLQAGSSPHLEMVWQNGSPGTSPVIAGGLLYVYDASDGLLKVYRPQGGKAVASLRAGPGHWSSPIVIGGRIILPVGGSTPDDASGGDVFIYHLPGR